MRQRWTSLLCICFVLGLPAGAGAQQPESNAEQEGRAKFDAAREALKKGDTREALALFQASLAFNKTAGTLLNLASCEEALGLLASASKHYREAAALLNQTDTRVSIAVARVTALEPRIPTLRVRLDKAAPAATTVLLDDRTLGPDVLDTDMPLDPGKYVVSASTPGSAPRRYEVVLEERQRETKTVSPFVEKPVESAPTVASASAGPVASPPPQARPPAATTSPWRTIGLVTLGVGGAGVLVGAVSGGLAVAKRQEIDQSCPGNGPRDCAPSLGSAYTTGTVFADVSTLTLAIGGAALAGGVVMVALSRHADEPAPATHLAVGPGTVSVHGRF